MTIPTVLVSGTHGYTGTEADVGQWWFAGDSTHPPSAFVAEATRQGVTILGAGDPFEWSTDLGGLWGSRRLTVWKSAGQALRWYALAHGALAINIVAYSHGGSVAVYAAARRVAVPRIHTLVTVGMPIRADLTPLYARAVSRVRRWVHLVGGRRDWWQLLGGVGDWRLGVRRTLDDLRIETVVEPGADHGGLLESGLWTDRGWWEWLKREAG